MEARGRIRRDGLHKVTHGPSSLPVDDGGIGFELQSYQCWKIRFTQPLGMALGNDLRVFWDPDARTWTLATPQGTMSSKEGTTKIVIPKNAGRPSAANMLAV